MVNGDLRKILAGIVTAAIVGLGVAVIDLYSRIAVIEAGPHGNEVITRLVTIEIELRRITAFIDEEYSQRRATRFRDK